MDLFTIISLFVGFIVGITIHEAAHAWMGHRLGDPTAKDLGRISLNPIKHIDPIGTILLPLVGLLSPAHVFFGWAKPTPYNPENLKDGKTDEAFIALAGPVSNILLASLLTVLIYVIGFGSNFIMGEAAEPIINFIYLLIVENLFLAFFNLLPIPPLDGSSLLKFVTPSRFSNHFAVFNQFGFVILMVAFTTPLGDYINYYMDSCVNFCLRIVGLS